MRGFWNRSVQYPEGPNLFWGFPCRTIRDSVLPSENKMRPKRHDDISVILGSVTVPDTLSEPDVLPVEVTLPLKL